jgi:hypothetical protein
VTHRDGQLSLEAKRKGTVECGDGRFDAKERNVIGFSFKTEFSLMALTANSSLLQRFYEIIVIGQVYFLSFVMMNFFS